jgi:hypothetical protein
MSGTCAIVINRFHNDDYANRELTLRSARFTQTYFELFTPPDLPVEAKVYFDEKMSTISEHLTANPNVDRCWIVICCGAFS